MRKFLLGTLVLVGGLAQAKTVGTGQMQHCPTAVKGAKTVVTDTADGVQLTVTGKDEAEIRKRAKYLAQVSTAEPTSVEHQGTGHGGGGLGECLVVLKDTTVSAEDVPGGSKITVKPQKPIDVEWLKKETKNRQMAMNAPAGSKKKEKAK